MSEQDSSVPVEGGLRAGDQAAQAVGTRLRELREQRGWSQDEVSVRLKFGVRQIRALEEERWSDLPHGMSLRGFVRNYARLLEVDPEPLLVTLSPVVQDADPVSLEQASFLSSPLAKTSTRSWPVSSRRKPAPWLIGGLMVVIALVLLGYALTQQGKLPFINGSAQALRGQPAGVAVQSSPGTVAEQPLPMQTAPADAIAPPATQVAPIAPVPDAIPSPAPSPKASDAAGQAQLVLNVSAASWVEVRQADGIVSISRVLQPGERYELGAAVLPLRIVIGNVAGVTLSWRGVSTDLSPYRRDNVARLTLQ